MSAQVPALVRVTTSILPPEDRTPAATPPAIGSLIAGAFSGSNHNKTEMEK